MSDWEESDAEEDSHPTEVLPAVGDNAPDQLDGEDPGLGTVEMDKSQLLSRLSEEGRPGDGGRKTAKIDSPFSHHEGQERGDGPSVTVPMPSVGGEDEETSSFVVPEHLIEQSRPTEEQEKKFVTLDIPLEKIDDPARDGQAQMPESTTEQIRPTQIEGFEFRAEVASDGSIRIPARYFEAGLVRPGTKIVVSVMPDD